MAFSSLAHLRARHRRLRAPRRDRVRRVGEPRADREQVLLDPRQQLRQRIRGERRRGSDHGVGLVDVPVGGDARVVLRHARAASSPVVPESPVLV
jgi:hypothetical protein